MKRGLALGFSIFALVFLSGCIDVEYRLLVDDRDGAEIRYTVTMNSLATSLQSFNVDSQDFLKRTEESARKRGYSVSPLAAENALGFTATKKVRGLSRSLGAGKDPFGTISDEIRINPGKDLKIWKGLFETEYRLDTVIDLRGSLPESPKPGSPPQASVQESPEPSSQPKASIPSGEGAEPAKSADTLLKDLTNSFVRNMSFTFVLGLPGKNAISNASSTSNGGSLMTWVLSPGQENRIQASLSTPNRRNMLIAGILGAALFIALAALAIIVIVRSRKRTSPSSSKRKKSKSRSKG
ncbi:MAG: hypothetical protein AB1407_07065 [Spirochaetota bacterium]